MPKPMKVQITEQRLEIERLRALTDELAVALGMAMPFLALSVRSRYPGIEGALARYREARR